MRRARGTKSLVHDAVDQTVDLVELGHTSTARVVVRILSLFPPFVRPVRAIDGVRKVLTEGVLASVKFTNRVVEQVTDFGLDRVLPDGPGAEPPMPLRSDGIGSMAWMVDAAVGVVNGVVGDHLSFRVNGLDLGMALRGDDGWIEPDGTGIPSNAGPKIVVLVHGLATTEWSWCLRSRRALGDPAANFGTLLQRDLGHTPVFVRYNTGRHISENGRALSQRLEALVASWPVPVEEIVLIGHSMGGLVSRSACHIGHEEEARWVRLVEGVVTLASPLRGARLERFGHTLATTLASVDLPGTTIPARIINARSAGIKDLRYGYVQDREWTGRDPDVVGDDGRTSVPLPPHIAWCFISATLGATPGHPLSVVLGDLLVEVESASGPADPPQRVITHHVGGVNHVGIQVDPTVYVLVRDFVSGLSTEAEARQTA